MGSQGIQIFLLLVYNLAFPAVSGTSESQRQNYYVHSIRNSTQNTNNISFDNLPVKSMSIDGNSENSRRKRHFDSEVNVSLKELLNRKKHFPGAKRRQISKRSLLFQTGTPDQSRQRETKVSKLENQNIIKNALNNSTASVLHIPTTKTSISLFGRSSLVNNRSETTETTISSQYTTKNLRWHIIRLTHLNNTDTETNDYPAKVNNSDGFSTKFQGNETRFVSSAINSVDNWYSSAVITIDLQILFQTNNSEKVVPENKLNDSENFSDIMLYDLKQTFRCVIAENIPLNISCRNVTLYSIGEYLPNETSILSLTHSNQIMLLKPLFPHLKRLKSLTLSNNHHRYITKAFMGLENLEILDLSNNDIMALLRAFSYIPRLNVLNLSNNQIRRIGVVSDSVSYLKSLQNLTLDHNIYINRIIKEDFDGLKNCNLTLFSLFNTTLRTVEIGAFDSMSHLKVLEISVNYLNKQALANITCSIAKSIEVLYLRQMLNINGFPYDAIKCLVNTKMRELRLSSNYFRSVPVLPNFSDLRLLSLSNCSLKTIERDAFKNVQNLEILSLTGNKFAYMPSAVSSAKNLKRLYMDSQNSDSYNPFQTVDHVFRNLTHLETLGLSRLYLASLSRYCLHGMRNLKIVYLSLARLTVISDYAFETLGSLEVLDLRGNGIETVNNYTFYGLKSLRHLLLTGNMVAFISSVYPFKFTPLLSVIMLQYNQIENIPKDMFANLEELEILLLGRNKLLPWTKTTFHPNSRIKILDLSRNNIDYISPVMLTEFHQVTNYLDLSNNPFNCSRCGMKEFQNFCLSSNFSLKLPISQEDHFYSCANPDSFQNGMFFDLELPEGDCQDLKSRVLSLMAIILTCSFILMIILVSSLCYTFRWYVRYWIFHFKTNFKRRNSFLQKSYLYDAFIIYSSTDTPWVVSHLIPALENQEPRYKLCIHQRDFQVGRQITENILEAIENSRKVILILTEGFIKSEWCMYELHLAQHKLFGDTRDILILVKLKAIDKSLYTRNVSYIEKTRRCFMWTDSHIGQTLFWDQIRNQLGRPEINTNFPEVT